jgi:hypothetical protein
VASSLTSQTRNCNSGRMSVWGPWPARRYSRAHRAGDGASRPDSKKSACRALRFVLSANATVGDRRHRSRSSPLHPSRETHVPRVDGGGSLPHKRLRGRRPNVLGVSCAPVPRAEAPAARRLPPRSWQQRLAICKRRDAVTLAKKQAARLPGRSRAASASHQS